MTRCPYGEGLICGDLGSYGRTIGHSIPGLLLPIFGVLMFEKDDVKILNPFAKRWRLGTFIGIIGVTAHFLDRKGTPSVFHLVHHLSISVSMTITMPVSGAEHNSKLPSGASNLVLGLALVLHGGIMSWHPAEKPLASYGHRVAGALGLVAGAIAAWMGILALKEKDEDGAWMAASPTGAYHFVVCLFTCLMGFAYLGLATFWNPDNVSWGAHAAEPNFDRDVMCLHMILGIGAFILGTLAVIRKKCKASPGSKILKYQPCDDQIPTAIGAATSSEQTESVDKLMPIS